MRKTITTLAAAAAVGLTAIAGAAPATAALSECPTGKVCLFADTDYGNLLGWRSAGQGAVNVSPGANDKMSSWSNKSSTNGRWTIDANSSGGCFTMKAKTNNSWVGSAYSDRLTSWATNGGC